MTITPHKITKGTLEQQFNDIFLQVAYNDEYFEVEGQWVITPEEFYLGTDFAIETVHLNYDRRQLPRFAENFMARDERLQKLDEFRFAKRILHSAPNEDELIFTHRHGNKIFAMGKQTYEKICPR
jgi:hypothetical protein